MNRSLPSLALLFILALAATSRADDRLRDVQAELKTQGFYFGEINGQGNTETTSAIRRFQIRNGLEVTGTLTSETITALGIGVAPGARPAQEAPPPAPPAIPPVESRRTPTLEESDRSFLRQEEARPRADEPVPPVAPVPAEELEDPSVVPAPRPLEIPAADLPVLFADTPYATAPAEVQESTLRRAQSYLASRGLYREAIDGVAGPATEEAILTFQRSARLPLTGRLDLETLARMNLLPGRVPPSPGGFVRRPVEPPGPTRIYRGIWIR